MNVSSIPRILGILSVGVVMLGACTGVVGSSELELEDRTPAPSPGDGSSDDPADVGFDPGDGSAEQEACATSAEEATQVPVNMFIAVDRSGSMEDDDKWKNARSAFTSFFSSPEADTLNVAVRFWPEGGCSPGACDTNACSQPHVPLGSLADPAHEQTLINAFNAFYPDGWTPMSAALAGATKWATEYTVQSEGTEKVVVVLLTDGIPTACDEDINHIAAHAQSAYAAAEVLTFAVGLQGSMEEQMNAIAQAGQTDHGYFIGNGNAEADLLAALKDIQQTIVACTFAMPESDDPTSPVDPNQVNMSYTPASASDAITIPQVEGPGSCATGGWYYDDPVSPAVMTLCPTTCDLVQADLGAKIEIVLGCTTVVH